MEIKLIKRKSKTTNRVSISLEYYMGYTKTEEGKIKHNRKYETLEYYLIDPALTKADKEHNKVSLEMVEAVKAKSKWRQK